jgi:hypothetical protein
MGRIIRKQKEGDINWGMNIKHDGHIQDVLPLDNANMNIT